MPSMTDYNAVGADYVSLGFQFGSEELDVLQPKAQEVLDFYRRFILQEREKASPEEKERMAVLLAAFDQLIGFLLQVRRIGEDAQRLPRAHLEAIKKAKSIITPEQWDEHSSNFSAPAMLTIPSRRIYLDFESLLFRATSVLDVLARYVSWESVGDRKNNKFSVIRDKIYATDPVDIRADYLWSDLGAILPVLDTVLSGQNDFKGLRNLLMHNTSVPQLTRSNFVLHWLDKSQVLIFDHEIEVAPSTGDASPKIFPVLHTTQKLCQAVSWFLYRTAYQYSCRSRVGTISYNPNSWPGGVLNDFRPIWTSPCAVFSHLVSSSQDDQRYSVSRTQFGGATILTEHLEADVNEFILEVQMVQDQ